MSGIEVAGLILGAIPLVVVAMEKYAVAYSAMKKYAKSKEHLKMLIDELQTEQGKLLTFARAFLLA
jgi:hypothetical protein